MVGGYCSSSKPCSDPSSPRLAHHGHWDQILPATGSHCRCDWTEGRRSWATTAGHLQHTETP